MGEKVAPVCGGGCVVGATHSSRERESIHPAF